MSGSGDQRLRAATTEQGGYRSDTDDVVADLELTEAEINPAEQRKRAHQTGPGGAMMPPMMGGMANPNAAGAVNAARAGMASPTTGLAGGTALTTSGAGTGIGPLVGGGTLGGGTLGPTSGALGSGAGAAGGGGLGTMAAGSSGNDYGFGINPATGWATTPTPAGGGVTIPSGTSNDLQVSTPDMHTTSKR